MAKKVEQPEIEEVDVLIQEIPEAPVQEEEQVEQAPVDDFEKDFEQFVNSTTTHEAPAPAEEEEPDIFNGGTSIDGDMIKLKIFMTVFFVLLDGVHVFLYNMMSKYKLTKDDIGLDDSDRDGLELYFKTPRVMGLINKLPTELIGFIHIEYMYFQKFQDFTKQQKELEKQKALALFKKVNQEEEQEEEEQEEETSETPVTPPKKQPAKKRPAKKRAAKKRAVKKTVKEEKSE